MIAGLDHLVLTVADLDATVDFYVRGLGMRLERFRGDRLALHFGDQKINLHLRGREFDPKAAVPMPGSADLCFLVDLPVDEVLARLGDAGLTVLDGPVERTGATGPILSVYLRDPDGNLIELARPLTATA